ncbi:hypothetical protein [Ectobacillus antri]|jgi:hypothetical protein|uniref:hypothetical protein n=1 Tax=Ectobacillus antri TaxID=2486280 RepID=UPI000F591929|nr:hypothetical protein [Ectobacillus antri]
MVYEILFSHFIGTQHVTHLRHSETGAILDYTPNASRIQFSPDIQQYVRAHFDQISSSDTDYNGLIL